ncbi:unnamed protein product [Malus baccata var. baccata]
MAANFWTSSHYCIWFLATYHLIKLVWASSLLICSWLIAYLKSMSDPRLVAPTCLYLASKAEESARQAKLLYRYEVNDILEMEMKILEALNYYLVVYHPYRSLSHSHLDNALTTVIFSLISLDYYLKLFHSISFQVKNISMEILDFYENHRMIPEERFNAALNKLAYKP